MLSKSEYSEKDSGYYLGWVFGIVHGILTNTAIIFLNSPFGSELLEGKRDPILLFGLLGFLFISVFVFVFMLLRRIFSAKARQDGWGPVIGFFIGISVAATALLRV